MRAILAIVALVSQIVLGSLVLPDRAATGPLDALHAAIMLCQGSAPVQATPAHHRQRHPGPETTCPLDVALELPAVILVPAVIIVAARLLAARRTGALPPARAPPTAIVWALRARGPPVLA